MLYFDVIRGEDSTGVALISKATEAEPVVEVLKSVGSASDFYYDHTPSKRNHTLTTNPISVMLGHNRFATQGAVNLENAHPFEFANLVGAHNGTVQMSSLSKFTDYLSYDVDSKIIYSHLSHLGQGGIDAVWEAADGALALTWWDKQDKTIKMIRNKERPLHVAYAQDNSTIFWASEAWMLWVAAGRHGLKIHDTIELVPNRLYTFTILQEGRVQHIERDLPPFVAKPVYTGYQGRSNVWSMYDDLDDDYWYNHHGKQDTTQTAKLPAVHNKPVDTSTTQLVIKEFHNIPNSPSAVAVTADGREVYVNIPIPKRQNAKDAIDARDPSKGYYVCKKLYRYTSVRDFDGWCNWNDLSWVKFRGKGHLIRLDSGGFQINWDREGMENSYAPWFHESQFLTEAGYKSKTACGCVSCNQTPAWEDRTKLKWISNENFFCEPCQESALVQDIIAEMKGA